jgi:23S rRNA pseudouridine1911/1915/1917 synthase
MPDASGISRIALHAATLGFTHPATGKHMHWTASLPTDMHELSRRLRGAAR